MEGYSTNIPNPQTMHAKKVYSHHFGSGVFSSLMPSHSWPVVSRPETASFSILVGTTRHPQAEYGPAARSSPCGKASRWWRRSRRTARSSSRLSNVEAIAGCSLAESFGVRVSEVHQRAEHLQVGNHGVGLGQVLSITRHDVRLGIARQQFRAVRGRIGLCQKVGLRVG